MRTFFQYMPEIILFMIVATMCAILLIAAIFGGC